MDSRQTLAPIAIQYSRHFVALVLQVTISLNVLPVRAQDKPGQNDQTIYVPGQSAEDRLKFNEKPPLEPRSQGTALNPPANDNFANGSTLIPNSGNGFGQTYNLEATGEVGEPLHGGGRGGSGSAQNSVWYTFTPTATGVLTIRISAGASDPPIVDSVVSVYIGGSVSSLTPLAENDDYPGLGLYSKITFVVLAGQTYHLAVDGYASATGWFYINYAYSTAAPNDNFSSSEAIAGNDSPFLGITGSNLGATPEAGEPNHAGNTGALNSIWYSWTPLTNLSMTFDTEGSNFDTTLSVYTGSAVNALTLVNDDDDSGPGISSRVTFIANAGTTYRIVIDGRMSASGNSVLNWHINKAESSKQFDFDGDLKTDFSVFRPSTNVWYTNNSLNSSFSFTQWGLGGDVLVPGMDWNGSGTVDVGVWRPSNGVFYMRVSASVIHSLQWGVAGDIPLQGDFDDDDRSDFAVWRPSSGTFYILQSRSETPLLFQWGQNGDKPATGDYDGDGRTDLAVWRPSNGTFYILRSSNGSFQFTTWGINGDVVVPGDYDRDGKNDVAVYRPSSNIFYAIRSSTSSYIVFQWGLPGDLFAPGDYDGNGYSDICVWRPSTGTFYVYRNPSGSTIFAHWGQNGDVPVANSNVH